MTDPTRCREYLYLADDDDFCPHCEKIRCECGREPDEDEWDDDGDCYEL